MKTLFALLWLSAMIWLAAPAHAHPDEGGGGGTTSAFLPHCKMPVSLIPTRTKPSDRPRRCAGVWTAANRLDGGESGLELVHDVKTHNPGFNMEAASQFAVLAATYYCPHHLSHA